MSKKLNIDNESIKEIDRQLEELEFLIKRGEALEKLLKDENFKILILEGYYEVEAKRVFSLLTHPLTVKPEDKASYLSQLDTIKDIARYLGNETYKGTVAITAINALKAKEELIAMKQKLIAGEGA